MTRTYRILVKGRFENLSDDQRKQLLAEQDEHDMFAASYTPQGTFLYTPVLVGYQFRYLLHIDEDSPADADVAAEMEAHELAEAGMRDRGLQGRIIDISLTCLEDMKIRGGKRR
ncbi:MAG: DUF6204 family protein [Propioniciclava sp.]|uniref:DUF6204 family protein n=1 Tax=Propioniciclava sp. TaxID=2038686 RepID=UPI0039E2AD34